MAETATAPLMQKAASVPRDAYAIAAPVFLADDAAAALAITLAAGAHDANDTGTLSTRVISIAAALGGELDRADPTG